MRNYDITNPLSIFSYSSNILNRSLSDIISLIENTVPSEFPIIEGKGGLGILVEKYFFGYEPNNNPGPDFLEAGVELKVSPLKKGHNDEYLIKERLVCDMIDYFALANEDFTESRFFKKSMLMLILFYLHVKGCPKHTLKFIYSVLWSIKDKDLLIIREDFIKIREKVRQGLAHELSEGDTMYLGACRKGQKNQALRRQPCSEKRAHARAFALKPAYMRTILNFVRNSGKNMVSNLTESEMPGIELVSTSELMKAPFETILLRRFEPYIGMDYKQISLKLGYQANSAEKSRYATLVRKIIDSRLFHDDNAEEFRKSGIKIKTIRLQKNGLVKEHMSFEQIDYNEIKETTDWIDSKWYEIITTRYLFVIFREVDDAKWKDEPRFVLDRMFFWTMPPSDYSVAESFWENIKTNVMADTLQDEGADSGANTFWKLRDHKFFHVRPKARNSADTVKSPLSGKSVPRKAYWFENRYLRKELIKAYGADWSKLFATDKSDTNNHKSKAQD